MSTSFQALGNIQRLSNAGYTVEAHPTIFGAVVVSDPVHGYKGSKFGVVGYNKVTVLNSEVSKFISDRN